MSLGHGASIVRDGLVLCLDAANPKSYPGTGTTWFDLSDNGNHATLFNSPTFVSDFKGAFVLDNVDDYMTIPNLNFETLGVSQNFTFMFGAKKTAYGTGGNNNGNSSLINGSSSGYSNGWRIIEVNGGTPGSAFSGIQRYSFGTDLYADSTITLSDTSNRYAICAFSRNTTSAFAFLNGVTALKTFDTYIPGTNLGRIGNPDSGAGRFAGYLSFILVYNRALSAAEIQQNFNATRSRYGI